MPNGLGLVITFRLIKENKMFTFQSVLDNAVKTTKGTLSYVEDKGLRSSLENVVDANANFAKTIYENTLEISKQVVEKMGANDYTKQFANFAKTFTK